MSELHIPKEPYGQASCHIARSLLGVCMPCCGTLQRIGYMGFEGGDLAFYICSSCGNISAFKPNKESKNAEEKNTDTSDS